jgi:hypothetical protein
MTSINEKLGLKPAGTRALPAGLIPLVAIERHKIDTPHVRQQLQRQVDAYGKPIRLVGFDLTEDNLITIVARGTSQTSAKSQKGSQT